MSRKVDFEKFKDFLANEEGSKISSDELQQIVSWIHGEQSKAIIEEEIKAQGEYKIPDQDFEEIYARILGRISSNQQPLNRGKHVVLDKLYSRSSRKISRPFMIAASIVLLLTSSYFLSQYMVKSSAEVEVAEVVIPITKQALKGEKLNIQLNDGTKIKLNSQSTLTYFPESYSTNRTVKLDGEAFFDVSHDETRPFKVLTSDGFEVKVLGTSFIVNTSEDSENSVAVQSGKVLVQKSEESVVLSKDEFTRVTESLALNKDLIKNEDLVFGWVENKMVLENASFGEVLRKIDFWFGYEIKTRIDFSDFDKYSGSLTNPSLREVMESLSHSYKFQYKIDEKTKQIMIE